MASWHDQARTYLSPEEQRTLRLPEQEAQHFRAAYELGWHLTDEPGQPAGNPLARVIRATNRRLQ